MGKFKFSYKRFAVTVMVGAILAATTATAAFSYAWFTNHNNVTNNDLHGSTAGAYFARGDGSSTNPYVINKPIHLYNLAWLQYIGAFDDKEPYFIIEANLDMSGWALPPIGTTEHPFKGHLDGYDEAHSQNQTSTAKISNLTISNDFAAYNGKHPAAVTKDNFQTLNITGLFGVIEQPTKDTTTPSLQNLYVDKLTVSSTTGQTLTGLVAGYVNGKIDGVGISDSKLDLASATPAPSYKNTTFNNVSKYTSVGYCTENYERSYVKTNTTMYTPVQVGDPVSFNPTGAGGGTENDWGGSIDMMSLNKRLTYISAVSNISKYGNWEQMITPKKGQGYQLYGYVSNSESWHWNSTGKPVYYIMNGTLMPLNIDENTAFLSEVDGVASPYDSSDKWKTTSYYKTNSSEYNAILQSNTGYLVGGGASAGSISAQSKIRSKMQTINSLKGSYNGVAIYEKDKFTLYTIDTTKGTSTVEAQTLEGTFQKYSQVRSQFDDSMAGSSLIHGFHFMPYIETDINKVDKLQIDDSIVANISGVACKSPYQFVKGALNFTVKNPGYITTITGSYYNNQSQQTLFDLFKVDRDDQGRISSVKQVRKIFKSSDGEIRYSYNGDDLDGEMIFNFDRVSGVNNTYGCFNLNTAYYFEFPVLPGDYAIGKSANSKDKHAYLMYLDIGANAGGTSGNKVDRTKIYEVFEQVNEEFKYPNGVEIVNFANAGVDSKKFAVVVGAFYAGEVKLNYAGGNNANVVVIESSDTGLGYYDAGLRFTSGQTKQVGATTTHTRTQRLTYFDYYRESELGTDMLYTNVLQFSQTQTMANETWGEWSTIARSDYQSGEGNTNFTKYKGILTIFGDDGKSTTTLPDIKAPESYGGSIVFTLQTTDPTIPSIDADWIQTGSYPTGSETSPYVFEVSGYKFTMNYNTKDGVSTTLGDNQYTATRNSSHAVSINGVALA